MTDADATFALGKAKDIKNEAWHVLCDRFTILEDMRERDERGQQAREVATIYLLGVIAETLLSERLNNEERG